MVENTKKRNWPRLLASVLCLIAGIIAFANPGLVSGFLVTAIGIVLLITGITRLMQYFGGAFDTSGWDLAMGILDILAGLAVLTQPLLFSAMSVGVFIACYVIFSAATHLYYAFTSRKLFRYWWVSLIWGILAIILGIVMLASPLAVAAGLGIWTGIFLGSMGLVGILNFLFNTQRP